MLHEIQNPDYKRREKYLGHLGDTGFYFASNMSSRLFAQRGAIE